MSHQGCDASFEGTCSDQAARCRERPCLRGGKNLLECDLQFGAHGAGQLSECKGGTNEAGRKIQLFKKSIVAEYARFLWVSSVKSRIACGADAFQNELPIPFTGKEWIDMEQAKTKFGSNPSLLGAAEINTVTRPAIILRLCHDTSAYGIEMDVAQ